VRSQFKVSERQACRVLGQHRCTQRHIPKWHADEDRLVADMIELARQFGRHGYRRIAALLREAGWSVSDGRIEQISSSLVTLQPLAFCKQSVSLWELVVQNNTHHHECMCV